MSELYDRISDLCREHEINITTMCKASGASRASLSDLKQGRKQRLSADTLSKIASYFNVSVDYLLGRTSDPIDYDADGEAVAEVPLSYIEACDGDVRRARKMMLAAEQDALREKAAEYAGNALKEKLIQNPHMLSSQRVKLLFDEMHTEIDTLLMMAGIERSTYFNWINNGVFPGYSTVIKIQNFFQLDASYFLTPVDLDRCRIPAVALFPNQKRTNTIKIAGRDGSYEERTLTDDQMEALKAFIKLLPDASDDL